MVCTRNGGRTSVEATEAVTKRSRSDFYVENKREINKNNMTKWKRRLENGMGIRQKEGGKIHTSYYGSTHE